MTRRRAILRLIFLIDEIDKCSGGTNGSVLIQTYSQPTDRPSQFPNHPARTLTSRVREMVKIIIL